MVSRQSKMRLLVPVITILVLLVAGSMGVTMGSFGDTETSMDNVARVISGWYDLKWGYRKPITLNNSGSLLGNYQINLEMNTAALVTGGRMLPDGADIRFTTSDGTTEMPYWIESGINSAATSLWVKVPEVPAGASTIYIYYGYSGAEAASSFEDVFPQGFFEDLFDDEDLIDWLASQGILVDGGQVELDVSAGRVERLDQVQLQGGVAQTVSSSWMSAQSITVGITGLLTRAEFRVRKSETPTTPLIMEVRNAVGDTPGSTVYATVSKDPGDIGTTFTEHQFILETPMIVEAGEKYTLVFRTTGDSSYAVQYITSDVYSNGAWTRSLWPHDGSAWEVKTGDLYLRTFVDTSWRVDQEQTGITGTRQVYDENWWAQSFLAGMNGQLKQISLDMARIGTPPNEVTVEVRNVVQVAGEILDQSQISYSTSGQVYGDNWEGQTFRIGSNGQLTKVALTASRTGAPGDLTVELRDVQAGVHSVLDQSQASQNAMRQVYGDNWAGQVFQAGLDGNLGLVRLWASATGSPAGPLIVELRDAVESGDEVLDQSNTVGWSSMAIYDDDMTAQIFTAGMSGQLTSVALEVSRTGTPPDPLTIEVRNVTGEGLPGSIVYATTGRSDISTTLSEHVFTFASPATLISGVKYCIVVGTTGGTSSNGYAVKYNAADSYDGGHRATTWWGGVWNAQLDNDLIFKTYMTVSAYLPGDTVHAAAARSDIGAAGEYEFTFDSPHAVTPGTRYALVVYMEGGSSANRYDLGYQGSDVYAGGREYASADAGDNWTGSGTDLYFRTYNVTLLGDTPGETVYATATRSDIGTSAGEYEFVLDTPRAVSAGENYAIVVYAGGGNASNYYSIHYEDSEVYALGKRASSDDGGELWTPDDANDLYFKVWVDVPAGQIPGETIYATSTRNIFVTTTEKVEFLFDTTFTFVAGQRYAFVVRTIGGDDANYYLVSYQYPSAYPRGNESYSLDDGDSWIMSDCDLWFMIYVEGGAVSDQYQTIGDDFWQVYDAKQVAQIFQVQMDGDLRQIVLKAASAGSPPGALTVEVRDVEEVVEDVLDQYQTTGTHYRDLYGDNWSAQLFQSGYSGSLRYVTLRIGETGSPTGAVTVELRDVVEGFAYALDQSQTVYDGYRNVYGVNWLAQSFQAGMTGDLGRVTLRAARTGSPGDLIVEIRDLVQILQYALDQSQTGRDGYRQVFGDNWSGQVFEAGATGDLGRVTLRLGSAGSPGGTVTVELRDVVEAFAYAVDQSQETFTDYRQVYGSNWIAQLFQAGDSGDLGMVTVRASKQGTPGGDLTVELRDAVPLQVEVKDKSQNAQNAYYQVFGTNQVAQTFTAGVSGELSRVVTYVQLVGGGGLGDLQMSIRQGGPSGSLLGSVTVPRANVSTTAGTLSFDFSSLATPIQLVEDVQYAIVLSSSGGNNNHHYRIYHSTTGGYQGESRYISTSGGGTWTLQSDTALYFDVHINTEITVPGSTVRATASRSDIGAAGDYDFTFATPYSVTDGTGYAIVVRTSGGDVDNYYAVAYNGAGGYAGGSECSSGDAGSNWTAQDADLYFKTHFRQSIGLVPGSTVHASASRGDITSEADYHFDFATPHSIASGTGYAIVVKAGGGDASNYYAAAFNSAGGYADGRECSSSDAGFNWTPGDSDLYFATYMVDGVETLPGDTVYATASRSDISTEAVYDFDFATPHSIASGTSYAIVVRTGGGDASNYYAVAGNAAGGYVNGREFSSDDGGDNWSGGTSDLYFKTHVWASAGNIPGDEVHAAASLDDIDGPGDYNFVFDETYQVVSGRDYALVVYAAGGSASDCYTVAYNPAGGYAGGRECLSTDGGDNWEPGSGTDLYFKTYVITASGYKPGTTVVATASRSDIGLLDEYEFDFSGEPITGGQRYAIVVKTAGGSLENHYEVAFQSSDVYDWGNLSYTDDGIAWAITDYDLWFKVHLDLSISGVLRSVAIPLSDFQRLAKGIQLSWIDETPEGTDIKYRVEYYNGLSWVLVPDSVLPGNSTGFHTSPEAVSGLTLEYEQIRLRANLSTVDVAVSPSIQEWKVTYYYRENATVPPIVSGIGGEE